MVQVTLITTLALAGGIAGHPAGLLGRTAPEPEYPHVELWVTERDFLGRGDLVRVRFRSASDAYVTVFRIDTDGRIHVLFPADPEADNLARGGEHGDAAFVVDDYPGTGYLFALASLDPLDYSAYVDDKGWDFRAVSHNGRIRGDPYVALTDLVQHIVPEDYAAWAYDIVPYLVEKRYDPYATWDPYRHWCGTFRQPTYDDPYLYLTASFPALERALWPPPVAPTPVSVSAQRTAGATGSAPAPVARRRPGGERAPVAPSGRVRGGGRGGTSERTATRGGQPAASPARPATGRRTGGGVLRGNGPEPQRPQAPASRSPRRRGTRKYTAGAVGTQLHR